MPIATNQRLLPLFSLTVAAGLHLAVTAALLWLTARDPWLPPRSIEVSLVTMTAPEFDASNPLPTIPVRPVRQSAQHTFQRSTPPIPRQNETPIALEDFPVATPIVAETALDPPAPPPVESNLPTRPPTESTGEAIEPPRYNADYLHNPPPAYPPMAKRLKIEGKVLVHVLIDASGRPDRIELAQSSGSAVLDRAALNAVRQWTFIPARQGTEAVSAWVEVPIRFHLQN